MAKKKLIVKLTFPQELIKKPVIYTMAKKYDVIPNIRRAKVTEESGEMVLELSGLAANLEKGVKYLQKTGVVVELGAGDIVE